MVVQLIQHNRFSDISIVKATRCTISQIYFIKYIYDIVNQVGFTIEIYYDARSYKRQML